MSEENACENLDAEQGSGPDFDRLEAALAADWEATLGVLRIEGGSPEDRTLFTTALYHCCLHPNIIQDVNGEYPLMGHKGTGRIPQGRNRYTVFSLWDTYRSTVQLVALLWPERLADMIATMLDMADETGYLPKWELCGNETYIMPGDPAVQVIADALQRKIPGIDPQRAYAAMKRNADQLDADGHSNSRPGLAEYIRYGFMPHDAPYRKGPVWTTSVRGAVSCTLEYAHADWCLSQIAEQLGVYEDAQRYAQRARSWIPLFDPDSGFIRPKNADGSWLTPFDPAQKSGGAWDHRSAPGFVEGNAWQYTFMIAHDIPELIARMGGPEAFAARLQACFDSGEYDATNEPDMAYPFLFNYVPGQEVLTQRTVRRCIQRYWHAGRDGIPGNDDCGSLSAWLVFAMLGFYPDCAGRPVHQLCSPWFDKAVLHPETEHRFEINVRRHTPDAWRIDKILLNGAVYRRFDLSQSAIAAGGELLLMLT